jgi:hypothetical protein
MNLWPLNLLLTANACNLSLSSIPSPLSSYLSYFILMDDSRIMSDGEVRTRLDERARSEKKRINDELLLQCESLENEVAHEQHRALQLTRQIHDIKSTLISYAQDMEAANTTAATLVTTLPPSSMISLTSPPSLSSSHLQHQRL